MMTTVTPGARLRCSSPDEAADGKSARSVGDPVLGSPAPSDPTKGPAPEPRQQPHEAFPEDFSARSRRCGQKCSEFVPYRLA